MPSSREPIEARVVDGVAHADTSTPAPPRAPLPPRMLGNWGCLLFPSAMAITSLILGLWLLSGWNTLSPLQSLAAIVLTMFGVGMISLIATLIMFMLRLRRLMHNLARDAKKVAEAMQQVATMKVPPQNPADAQAPADSDDAIATDPALPAPPPAFPDASETPENTPPT